MTPEEAIERMKYIIVLNATEKDYEAILMGIDALEKRTPKSPKVYADGKMIYHTWVCPHCGCAYEIKEKSRYCIICGQKLNWSAVEIIEDDKR